MRTAPALASMKPAIMRKVVVLPQPDGPSSTTNSPSATSSDRSSTASTSANFLLMLARCNAAIVTLPSLRGAAQRRRSNPGAVRDALDCFVASLLAMTSHTSHRLGEADETVGDQ